MKTKIKYSTASAPASRVHELPSVSASELKNSFADVFEQVGPGRAIAITKHDKPRAVLLSIEDYEAMAGKAPDFLQDLELEYREMLVQMQSPEQKAAAKRAFNATPETMGKAAVATARRKPNP